MKNKVLILLLSVILYSCGENNGNSDKKPITLSTEDSLLNALQQHPDSLLLRENLIQFYREADNYEQALQITQTGIERDSLNPRLYQIKGTLLFEYEDTIGAIKAFENTVRLLPVPQNLSVLGVMYAQQGNSNALLIAQELAALNPPIQPEADFIRGVYHATLKNEKEAIKYFDACILMNHTFMDAYREKAILLYHLKKHHDAIDVLLKATTLKNNFDIGYYLLGQNYEQLKDTILAIENYDRALLYDPNYWEAKDALNKLTSKH